MKIAVIGGGPAGMMAAIAAADGSDVTLFEKNEKLGKKLYISGKGRCNLTNNCSVREFFDNVATNSKFLYGAINKFSPADTIRFCEQHGLSVKTERGNRVFPASDKASDVTKMLMAELSRRGVKVALNCPISRVECRENAFLLTTICGIVSFDRVILATGGVSYSSTGSTGDGYRFAEFLGHSIVRPKSALCRILCKDVKSLEGLSLKNVTVKVQRNTKTLDSEFGEMVFTDNGIGGPAVLTLSSRINKLDLGGAFVAIDLKPALDSEVLDARILRDFSAKMNKNFVNSLDELLPERLIKEVAARSGIPFDKKVNQITSDERARLGFAVKNLRFELVGLDNVEYGIVTCGGVDVKEIDPSTMESKLVKGLYFAGEMMDVDAYTGGFNIQIAFSTGFVAGNAANRE